MAGDSKLLVRFGCDSDTTGQPGGPGIGVKICAADHKLLETQSMPPTLHGGAAGCEGGILTPMLGPPVSCLTNQLLAMAQHCASRTRVRSSGARTNWQPRTPALTEMTSHSTAVSSDRKSTRLNSS